MSRQSRGLRALIDWLWVVAMGCFGVACSNHAVLELFPDACAMGNCPAGGSTNIGSGSGGGSGGTDGGAGATGGSTASTGGSGASTGSCGTLAERVHTTELELPRAAMTSDEYNPMLLAPRADNSSLLGYREAASENLSVVELDGNDRVTGTLFRTEGLEAHALLAHDDGAAFVVVREDPDIFSPEFCRGGPGNLAPCGSLELVRFDSAGRVTMSATLTDKLNVADEGALFIYWFEHTARMAWADDTYGVYFRSARTIPTASGLTPRPGDTLRFVDSAGTRLDRGWDFGCIPSWSVRIAHNGVWAAVCHGETPNAHRLVILDGEEQRQLLFLEGIAPAYRALGGLTTYEDDFWLSYLQRSGNLFELHLVRVTQDPTVKVDQIIEAAVDLDYETGYVFRTYHATLGDSLLLGWKSADRLVLARADIDTGELIEGPVVTDAPIDHFVEFMSFPNGDVGWAHTSTAGVATVTRVLGCVR